MLSKTLLTLAVLVTAAFAQSGSGTETDSAAVPTSTDGISPCVLGCVGPAATDNGCSSFADTACVCASQKFQADALACLTSKCTPAEQQGALALQSAACGNVNATGSATTEGSSATPTVTQPTASGASTKSGSSSSKPASTASTNATATNGTGTAPPASTTNAAVGAIEGMSLLGAVVAGIFGLVL